MARRSGKEFEDAFARIMEQELGFSATHVREPVKGRVAARAYDCDVHALRSYWFWTVIRYGAASAMLLACGLILFGGAGGRAEQAGAQVEAALGITSAGWGMAIIFAIVLGVAYVGKTMSQKHVWVECKDRKATIKRADITKLVSAVEDVRAFDDAKWKPDEVWFASTAPFDIDALNFAEEHDVRCILVENPEDPKKTEVKFLS